MGFDLLRDITSYRSPPWRSNLRLASHPFFVELRRQRDLNVLRLHDFLKLLSRLGVSVDHLLSERFNGIRLPFCNGKFACLDLVKILIALCCTNSDVLGRPHENSASAPHAAAIEIITPIRGTFSVIWRKPQTRDARLLLRSDSGLPWRSGWLCLDS